jgi:hypothetical protein
MSRLSGLTCQDVADLAAGFVLGALEPNQMHDVRDHLASCPQPHPEMSELGGVVPYLADSVEPVEPPVALRGRIVGAIEAEIRAGQRTDAAADRLISSLGAGSSRPVGPVDVAAVDASPARALPEMMAPAAPIELAAERGRRRSPLRWAAAIAAVVVIAALGAWNVGLSQQLSTAQQQQAALDRVLAIARQPGGQAAVLGAGAAGGPTGLAAVGSDGSFALALSGLPATTGSQVYEAWVVAPSGRPVPVGSFAVGSSGLGSLAATQAPAGTHLTVGLTREPASGATTPTLPMVVSGVTAQGN